MQAPPVPLPIQAPAQLEAGLWADGGQQVFAVLMGRRIPDLPARLAAAELLDHDCLWPGALEPQQQRDAPYLAQLKRHSPFSDWLLFEAAAGLGDWGLLLRSPASRLAVRSHLRGLLEARLPDGHSIALDWMDPPVLQAVLPLFDAAGLQAFMGPLQSIVVPAAQQWTLASQAAGRLQWQVQPFSKAA